MKTHMKRIGVVLGGIVGIFLLYIIVVLLMAMVTNYNPKPIQPEAISGKTGSKTVKLNNEYTAMTYNIGYCGLDESQDFFMDGGKNSGADSKEDVEENAQFISTFLQEQDDDFVLLQEVDVKGKRSYDVNQMVRFASDLNNETGEHLKYTHTFAYNYKLKYLPLPIFDPMGDAYSGIMNLTKATPNEAHRYTFDGKPSFPVNLFELKRCFLVNRYPIEGSEKEFVLINAHFSAFDKGGKIREKEVAHMQRFLSEEYELGNYILLGADFNHELPGTDFEKYSADFVEYPDWAMKFPDDFAPKGFSWGVDTSSPTCRTNDMPLSGDKNGYLTLDGFLVSDNIEIESTYTYSELGFKHSDHNPVQLTFKLLDK